MKIPLLISVLFLAINVSGATLRDGSQDSNVNSSRDSNILENASFDRDDVGADGDHPEEAVNTSFELQQKRHLFISNTNGRWRQQRESGRAVIPYMFGDGGISTADRNSIRAALDELEERTGCLKFKLRGSERNYINVLGNTRSCSSFLGEIGGGQDLKLGSGCRSKSTIQHEFMHALGIHHEQNRSDRNQFVTINFNAIRAGRENNFERESGSVLGSPYEYGSVMHYSSRAFSKDGSTRTIIPKTSGVTLGGAREATSTDIKKIKLYYQCEGAALRQWNDLNNRPCTSNCRCQSGQSGCGSDNNACHGSLVCSNNRCVSGSNPTPVPPPPSPTPTPSPSPSGRPWLIWQRNPQDGEFYCIDLKAADTANGNLVWYYRCNYTPAQFWYYDSNRYLRSSIDRNKCLIPSGGSTTTGKLLMIFDCWQNDDRFKWDWYSADDSIRPRNNPFVCIEPRLNNRPDNSFAYYLILDDCYPNWNSFYWQREGSRRLLKHQDHGVNVQELVPPPSQYAHQQKQGDTIDGVDSQMAPATHHSARRGIFEQEIMEGHDMDMSHTDDCEDSPSGWYDIFGRNCEWYAEDNKMNCQIYGSSYKNFGKTAMQACCACGHAAVTTMSDEDLNMTDSEITTIMIKNTKRDSTACWDMPDWYDQTGYGCDWYAEGENCNMYGDDYMGMGSMSDQNAKSACCACGGGQSFPPSMSEKNDTSMPGCSENPFGWTAETDGEDLIDCAWYGSKDYYCSKYGHYLGTKNKTANEACCECRENDDGRTAENLLEAPSASSGGNSMMLWSSSVMTFCTTALLGIALSVAI